MLEQLTAQFAIVRVPEHRGYRNLLFARLISALGTWTAFFAVRIAIFEMTGSAWWVALLLFCELVPGVVLGLVVGPLIDRWPRKRMMVLSDLGGAVIFAALPTGLVWVIEHTKLPANVPQLEDFIRNFPAEDPKTAAQAFIIVNFMAYFLLIPAMVPMAIATQSIIGEKVARSLEPQLATPLEVPELLAGKALAAALPAVTATWAVYVAYGLINGWIADPRLTKFVFSDVWIPAMLTLVPLICLFSVLLGIVVSSRVNDPRTAQQIGGFVVIPIIAIAVAQFFGGQPTFTREQVLIGDLLVAGLVGITLVIGSWAFDRESILTRMA